MEVDSFSINFKINDLQIPVNLKDFMLKVFKVIQSMSKREHINTTRKYINLWYRNYGTENKQFIELYFKSKSKEINYGN